MNKAYKTLFDQFGEALILVEAASNKVIDANRRFVELTGNTNEVLREQSALSLVEEKDREKLASFLNQADPQVDGSAITVSFHTQAGTLPATVSLQRLTAERDNLAVISVTALPSPKRKPNPDQYRLALDETMAGIWEYSIPNDSMILGKRYLELLGMDDSLKSIPFNTYLDLLHPCDRDASRKCLNQLLRGETNEFTIEHRLQNSSGYVWVECSGKVTEFDTAGKPAVLRGSATDISSRKHLGMMLTESQANLKALLNNTLQAFVLIDTQRKVKAFNQIASDIAVVMRGKPLAEGDPADIFEPEKNKELFETGLRKAFNGENATEEVNIVDSDNINFWLEYNFVPVFTESDGIIGVSLSIMNISPRKRAELELRGQREQYKMISELISDFAFAARYTTETRIRFEWITDAFERIGGFPIDNLAMLSEKFEDMIHPHDRAIARSNWKSLMDGHPVVSETRIVNRYGHTRWLRIHARPVWNEEKRRVLRFVGAGQDITDQKETENALRKNLEQYHSLIEALSEGILLVDVNGTILSANRAAATILGVTQEWLEGRSILHPHLAAVREDLSRCPDTEHPVAVTLRTAKAQSNVILGITNPDEEQLWVSMNTQPLHQPGEKDIKGVVVSLSNMTKAKRSEEQKQELEDELFRLSLVAQQTGSCVTLTDAQFRTTWVNEAFTRLTGYSPEEIIGKNPLKVLQKDDFDFALGRAIIKQLNTGSNVEIQTYQYTRTGEKKFIQVSIDPMFDAKENHIGFIGVHNDITEKVRREEELREAKEKAEEMNRLKSNFLSNMSHELRTPMNGILAYAGILREDLEPSSFKSMAETVYLSGLRLMSTLNSILDLAKIEADDFIMNPEHIDLEELLRQIIPYYKKTVIKKGIYLRFRSEIEAPEVYSDKRMLSAAIQNIIQNAVKYTSKGGITVTVDESKQNGRKQYRVICSDTGIGIPQEKQKIVFEAFRQATEGYNRGYEGSGLGLTIAHQYIERLGGSIELQSTPGKGTTVILTVPEKNETLHRHLPSAAGEENRLTENTHLPGQPDLFEKEMPLALIVDDDPFSVEVAKMCMQGVCRIEVATDGESAVELARQKRYDAILMDISLGAGMSGVEATRAIRNLKGGEHIPIVAMTAFTGKIDREEFLAAGCTHYIPKPFERDTILELLKPLLFSGNKA